MFYKVVSQFRQQNDSEAWYSVSLLTNCGGFAGVFDNSRVNRYGLLDGLAEAYAIRDRLRSVHVHDPHAGACQVIAVFDV